MLTQADCESAPCDDCCLFELFGGCPTRLGYDEDVIEEIIAAELEEAKLEAEECRQREAECDRRIAEIDRQMDDMVQRWLRRDQR